MPPKPQTLKQLFLDDPEMLRVLELREQTQLLREIADKKVSLEGIEQIKGEKGEMGEIGPMGPVGPIGPQGEKGEDSKVAGPRGERGLQGIAGKDGKDGIDGKSFTLKEAKAILDKALEELEATDIGAITEKDAVKIAKKHVTEASNTLKQEIANLRGDVMRNYGGHGGSGGGSPSMVYDLSSQLNGVLTSFTIPANTAIFGIICSNAPFTFRPTVDYTGSGTTTLSFTGQIDPSVTLTSGATLILQYY